MLTHTPLTGVALEHSQRNIASLTPVWSVPDLGIRIANVLVGIIAAFLDPGFKARPSIFKMVSLRAIVGREKNEGIVVIPRWIGFAACCVRVERVVMLLHQ